MEINEMDGLVLNAVRAAQAIHKDVAELFGPPEEGLAAQTHLVVPAALVRKTRGYIEKVTNQVNGCYENGWFDAAAVMVRRLLETLIIETFEHHNIAHKIKKGDDFLFLRDLIGITLAETTWNLSRNTRQALPKLKDIGDKSAHSRYYNAVRDDLSPLLVDIRMCVQELTHHAGLK
jgi:hypothetical protein